MGGFVRSAGFARTASLLIEVTRTSVIDFLTSVAFLPVPVFCTYSLVRISPSICTCAPLIKVAANSASRPKTIQRCQVVWFWRSPVSRSFQLRFVASDKSVNEVWLWVVRTSASLPRNPMRLTRF